MQAHWQDAVGVIHQALSASRNEQFGQNYGVWLKQWCLLQMAVIIIDRHDHIVYTEYIADQRREPDYGAAMKAVHRAALT
jgi:thiol peroxidase